MLSSTGKVDDKFILASFWPLFFSFVITKASEGHVPHHFLQRKSQNFRKTEEAGY